MDDPRRIRRRTALAMLAGWPLAAPARAADTGTAPERRQAEALARAQFTDATGAQHQLSELTRPLLLINLWAAWCPGCLTELPTISHLLSQLGPDSIDVVLLSHYMNWHGDVAFARQNRLPFRHWRLSPQSADATAASFRMEADRFGLPQSLVFTGRQRTLVHSALGSLDWSGPQQLRLARAWLAAAR